MDNKNLESTTYDVKAITNYDRRFEAGKKDAIFYHVLGGAASVIAVVLAFVFGTCDPSEMIFFPRHAPLVDRRCYRIPRHVYHRYGPSEKE